MNGSAMAFLVDWYASHCDGDWEHDKGVRIDTLDNPGWKLHVDLAGTELEGRVVDLVRWEEDDLRWVHWRSTGAQFEAACGPLELERAVDAFRRFASSPLHELRVEP